MQSLIYAAPRTDVKELHTVRLLLADKFGKEFALAAAENTDGKVAARVIDRLRVEPPKPELVDAYLRTIAEAYGVRWPRGAKDEEQGAGGDDDDDDEPSDGNKVKVSEEPLAAEELSKATPPRSVGPRSPVSVMPPNPSTDNVRPEVKLPGPPELKPSAKMEKAKAATLQTPTKKKEDGPGGKIPDVDELAKRFAQLKR